MLTRSAAHGPVFEEDHPRANNLRIDEFGACLRIAGMVWHPARAAKDWGKDHEPEAIDEPQLHHPFY
jgi:hypothetical protein